MAGANTAAGSKFLKKWDIAQVSRLRPAVARLPESGGFVIVATTSGLFRFSDLWNHYISSIKLLSLYKVYGIRFRSEIFCWS